MNVHTVTTLISRAGLTAVALFALAALTAHAQSDVTPPQNTTPPVLDEAPFDPAQDSLFLDPATEDVLDPAIDPADPVLDPFADVDLATDRFIGAFPGQSGEIRTALVDFGAGPVEITYEVIEGMAVFEGDMILGSADEIAALAASGPLV